MHCPFLSCLDTPPPRPAVLRSYWVETIQGKLPVWKAFLQVMGPPLCES